MIEAWEYSTECERCFHVLARHDDNARCTAPGCPCEPLPEPAKADAMAECPTCLHGVARHNQHGHCTVCANHCFPQGLELADPTTLARCPVCKRELPDDAYDTHLDNCKAAAMGYFGRGSFRA